MNDLKCLKDFAKYSSLNILGMIGLSCYILADTFFISKGLGADGLTALNLAIPIYSFINGSGLMLGIGGATKYSILKSQKKTDRANQVFTNAVLSALLLSAAFSAAGVFLSGTITTILGADETIFQMCRTYLQVIMVFAPMFMLNNVFLCFVRNDGAPQLSMAAMIGGSFSNIFFDYVFIFPCNMGILGAVLATALAPMISMLILSRFLFKRKNHFHMAHFKLSFRLITDIVSGGLPSFITEMSSGIVIIVFNIIILRLQGNTGVAAYGIIANLSLVVISIYTGLAQGIQPLISRNYGSGRTADSKLLLRYALISVAVGSVIIYAGVFFGAASIAGVFNSEHNILLEHIAVAGLKIYFTGCIFAGFNIILSIYFTSTEYAHPAHIISFLRGFLIVIPAAFLLSSLGGLIGVWCVFPFTELVVSAIGGILYFRAGRYAKDDSPE